MAWNSQRRILVAIVICSFSVMTAQADSPVVKLNEYMDAVVQVKQFNGSVLVSKDDQTLLSQGFGFANAEHEVLNTPQTKFRIGSITKQFTAMAVMILAEQQKLNVDDPIGKHLTDAPEAWDDVMVHHLLTHTSGIPSYTGMLEYGPKMMLPQTTEKMIARFRDQPLRFTPGEKFRYSNSGYFLLGAIIEQASGMSYDEFLREEIFDPLELNDSGYDSYRSVLPHRASGYERTANGIKHAQYLDMTQPYAAGSLYSTVGDLNRWDQSLRRRALISEASYKRMYTTEHSDYAYGWHVSTDDGRTVIAHGGGINGFTSFILRIPEEKLCVVALSNVQPSSPTAIARDLAAIVLGEKYDLPKQRQLAEVDPEVFDTYEGKYELQPGMVLTITREGDALMAEVTGQPKVRLLPESKTTFYEKSVDAELTFLPDADGRIDAAILKQGGREIRVEKIDLPVPN